MPIDTCPRLRKGAKIISEKTWYGTTYLDLTNGVTLHLRGDGTGTAENGTEYTCVSRGVGDPDDEGNFDTYEILGWVESRDCLY